MVSSLEEKSPGLRGGISGVCGSGSHPLWTSRNEACPMQQTVYDPGRTLFDQSRVEHFSHLVRHSTAETYSWVEQRFSG